LLHEHLEELLHMVVENHDVLGVLHLQKRLEILFILSHAYVWAVTPIYNVYNV
jgi:hypothetical protein